MNKTFHFFTCLLLAALAACASSPSAVSARDNTLSNYGAAIRWSEFTDAYQFVDPALRESQPLTDLEIERFKLIQVTGYDVKKKAALPDGSLEQTVEIRLISKNTQIERSMVDHQRWRWDPAAKQYWLTSGLPDFSAQ